MSYLARDIWTPVDYIVCSGATTPTFASGGNGVRGYVPSGTTDVAYRVTWDLIGNASGAIAQLELNGGTTNQTATSMISTGAAMAYTTYVHLGLVCNKNTASARFQGSAECFFAATGTTRLWYIRQGSFGATDGDYVGAGLYNDTATNITSIRFNVTTGTVTGRICLEVRNVQGAP